MMRDREEQNTVLKAERGEERNTVCPVTKGTRKVGEGWFDSPSTQGG